MICNKEELLYMLKKQVTGLLILEEAELRIIDKYINHTLMRVDKCFSHINNKYYRNEANEVCFHSMHQAQYTSFLYFLSNTIWRESGNRRMCDAIYFIMKMISSCDLFYEVDLPDVFFFDHPMSAVLGRADYSDYFFFSQGCTVGNNNGIYPHFGERVILYSDAKVIGKCKIGDNVVISANAYIKDTDIPSNSIVFGQYPNLQIKENEKERVDAIIKGLFV